MAHENRHSLPVGIKLQEGQLLKSQDFPTSVHSDANVSIFLSLQFHIVEFSEVDQGYFIR